MEKIIEYLEQLSEVKTIRIDEILNQNKLIDWLKIFDNFLEVLDKKKDVMIEIKIDNQLYFNCNYDYDFPCSPIFLDVKYEEFDYNDFMEHFDSFNDVFECLENSYKSYMGFKNISYKIEKLTLENEALKSAVESKKRRM